jgi:hypothetical protein
MVADSAGKDPLVLLLEIAGIECRRRSGRISGLRI